MRAPNHSSVVRRPGTTTAAGAGAIAQDGDDSPNSPFAEVPAGRLPLADQKLWNIVGGVAAEMKRRFKSGQSPFMAAQGEAGEVILLRAPFGAPRPAAAAEEWVTPCLRSSIGRSLIRIEWNFRLRSNSHS
jgi:hypothetical protein